MSKSPHRKPLGIWAVITISVYLLLCALVYLSAHWYKSLYGDVGFDSILWTLASGIEGTSSELLVSYARYAPPLALAIGLGAFALLMLLRRKGFSRLVSTLVSLALGLGFIAMGAQESGLPKYLYNQLFPSNIYEQEYVDPDSVEITFPEKKRNLIYLMLESMETTYLSQELGGGRPYNLLPNLTQLAQENTSFSFTDGLGGFRSSDGTTWTIAAMVAQTVGIPLKTPSGNANDYGENGEAFLPGVATITDILSDAGYHTAVMFGSDAAFCGREAYYSQHGIDRIYDIQTARADGIIPKDYYVWWGMEDLHLYEYAKQELPKMAQQEQPFALTLLTVDTHHVGGYVCSACRPEDYEESYEVAISCADRQVIDFLDWLKEQPFYEDTTVVVIGDHLSMDNGYFERNVTPDTQRLIYNCFLNAPVATDWTKNRVCTAMDMFPTTLAALGCTIEGERLGLGTNLFSKVPTLAESMGFEPFNAELGKASDYYAANFHQDPDA